jgi:LysR family transcriptional regulator, low CO2-responsive transcriptional regulator
LTLRQIEAFVAVERERSFTRAARSLNVSQSTLSEHVLDLERELGKELFVRAGRTILLSPAGRIFHGYATRIVTELSDARQAVLEIDGLTRGSLLLGASTTPGVYVLPRIIGSFRERYPGIDVKLKIANSRAIEAGVRANTFDLGVVGGHGLMPGEACLTAGVLDELILIVPPKHPWVHRRTVEPARLASEPLLSREDGSATRQVTERALQRADIRFRVAMELDHPEAIKRAVIAGLGIAFMSFHAVRDELSAGRLQTVRIRGLRVQRHFHVIHHEARALSRSARAFMEMLEQLAHETLGPGRRGTPRARASRRPGHKAH